MKLGLLLPLVALSFTSVACAVDTTSDEDVVQGDEEALSAASIVALDVTSANAPEGVTVIKSKADFAAFFGAAAPADVDFRKHWVVHVAGATSTDANAKLAITAIDATGKGASRVLRVTASTESAAPGCSDEPVAARRPQATVRIPKQSGSKTELVTKSAVAACELALPDLPPSLACKGEPITAAQAKAKFAPGTTSAFTHGFAAGASYVRDCYEATGCSPWRKERAGGYVPWIYWGVGGTQLRRQGWGVEDGVYDGRLVLTNGAPKLQIIDSQDRGKDMPVLETALPTKNAVQAMPWYQHGPNPKQGAAYWEDPLDCSVVPCREKNAPQTAMMFTPFVTDSCYVLTARKSFDEKDAQGNPRRRDVVLLMGGRL